jgi:HEAT repeat protein
LEDSESEVRKEAIIALNHIKSKQAIPPLAHCMKDKSPDVRRVAAIALGNSKSRSDTVVGALVVGLSDRDAPVRQACLSALTNCKASQALVNTISLLGDTHEEVSRQAAAAAVALAQAGETPEYDTGW